MLTNYHTHTTRCKHAQGNEDAYIEQAIREGFQVLGFSDHGPVPFPNGYVSGIRMDIREQAQYEQSIRRKAEQYRGRIEIRLGYEYEYFPKHLDLLTQVRQRVDYLLLGNHLELDEPGFSFSGCRTPEEMSRYADCTIEGLQTGLFACLAHPDLYLYSYPVWDVSAQRVALRLCKAARRLMIPLEYNLYGLAKIQAGTPGIGYPCEEFWRVAVQEGCRIIIGCDAHKPVAIDASVYKAAREKLIGMGAQLVYEL